MAIQLKNCLMAGATVFALYGNTRAVGDDPKWTASTLAFEGASSIGQSGQIPYSAMQGQGPRSMGRSGFFGGEITGGGSL